MNDESYPCHNGRGLLLWNHTTAEPKLCEHTQPCCHPERTRSVSRSFAEKTRCVSTVRSKTETCDSRLRDMRRVSLLNTQGSKTTLQRRFV